MIQENSRPLAVLYGYRSKKNEISFLGRNGLVTLNGKVTRIQEILSRCNGLNTVSEIAKLLPAIGLTGVIGLLSVCEEQGIVQDSRELFLGFHQDSTNLPNFSHDLTPDELEKIAQSGRLRHRDGKKVLLPASAHSDLTEILNRRKSTREFKAGSLPLNQLSGLLRATYGVGKKGRWTVASGGGMYPLDLYLIVPDAQQELPRGIYQWNPESDNLTLISSENLQPWFPKIFNAKTLLENAACILCIAADFRRPAAKYANLAYRLVLLEAGHAAQNTYLFCAEQNIGVVEYCGFADEALATELGLQFPSEAVISTLIIGKIQHVKKQTLTTDQQMVETAERLRQALVGDNKPISSVSLHDLRVDGYSMPQWAAKATYRSAGYMTATMQKRAVAFGTGSTSSEATLKVLAEGFERYALEQNRSDLKESTVNLREPFLDPRVAVPFTSTQCETLQDIHRFDVRRTIDWVAGTRIVSGERVWVPMELVYFANRRMKRELKLCHHASSSGVATHFDRDLAIKSALYELIERDAFCVTWYSKRRVHSIPHRLLSEDLRSRISCWEKLGYNVTLLNLTLDGPPVVLATIWSQEKTPGLCSGASCRPMFTDAVSKAFDEAEFMAMSWHDHKPKRKMSMGQVESPDDHGLFYVDPKNLVHAEWLLKAKDGGIPANFRGNLASFDPIVVDITPKEHVCGLKVVRVLSEKLMPMNFGYGNEHRRHQRMTMLQFKWVDRFPSTPHFFA